jgi:hypothetical protein
MTCTLAVVSSVFCGCASNYTRRTPVFGFHRTRNATTHAVQLTLIRIGAAEDLEKDAVPRGS